MRFLFLLTFSFLFFFFSCGKKYAEKKETMDEDVTSEQSELVEGYNSSKLKDTEIVIFEKDSFRDPKSPFFESHLRPQEKLYTNIEYIDTVEYINHDTNGDDYTINVKKGDRDVFIYEAIDPAIDSLSQGDLVRIVWEMDTMCAPGDIDLLWIDEWLIDIKRIEKTK